MRVQFGARLTAKSPQEFEAALSRLPKSKMCHGQSGPGWITTDFFAERWDVTYPRTILTNRGLSHASAFWMLCQAGPDDEPASRYQKRLKQLKLVFETLPKAQLDALSRSCMDLQRRVSGLAQTLANDMRHTGC